MRLEQTNDTTSLLLPRNSFRIKSCRDAGTNLDQGHNWEVELCCTNYGSLWGRGCNVQQEAFFTMFTGGEPRIKLVLRMEVLYPLMHSCPETEQ